MYLTQGLHRALQFHPNKIATRCGGRSQTFRELGERVARLASALHSLQVRAGDRVAILSLNSDRYIETQIAVAWAGAAINPCNIRWSAAEIAYSLNDSSSTVLIVDETFKEIARKAQAECPSIRHVIYAGDGALPGGLLDYEALLREANPVEDAYRKDDDLAGVFYTGGTTGFPKGVMLTHRNLMTSCMSILAERVITLGGVYLHAAPMFHLADFGMSLIHQMTGNTHVVVPMFNPEAVLNAIQESRVTDVLLVPTMIQMLLDHPAFRGADVSSLKRIVYGASPIAESLLDRAMAAFPGVEFAQAYGMTELSPLATINPHHNHLPEARKLGRHRSAGRASFCTEVRILADNGSEVPRGTVGEVTVRGPNVMAGYWNKPEQTATAVRDGWMHTGDAAYMDDEGYIYIVDRLKDMIVTGGENVYSAEVENALAQHSAVASCAVIGIPSAEWGEAVHAVVVLKPGAQTASADLVTHCRGLIAGYKCPRSISFETSLPLSGAGKVLKTELRKPFWDAGKHRFA